MSMTLFPWVALQKTKSYQAFFVQFQVSHLKEDNNYMQLFSKKIWLF